MKNLIKLKNFAKILLASVLLVSPAVYSASSDTAEAATSTPRLAHLQPFSSDSIWNTAIGSGAQFEPANSTKNAELRRVSSYINSNNGYGIAMNTATEADPIRSVTFQGKTFTHRIPENATVVEGSDGNLNVIDGQYVYEYWTVRKKADGNYTAGYGVKTDLLGSGVSGGIRAGQFSTNGGLIRKHELENLHMPHALVMALNASQMKKGWVFPAISEDGDNSGYNGSIPMGSLFAIPPEVDINSLGLSPEGLMLAKAMQDYGVYVGDKSSNVTLYASNDVEREMPAQFRNLVKDFQNILQDELRFVSNNSKNNIGGGGTPRQPKQPSVVVSANDAIPESPESPESPKSPDTSGTAATSFSDVPKKHIYYEEIESIKEKELINGYPDGTFKPNDSIKREHAAAIIQRSGVDLTPVRAAGKFSDVPKNHLYYSTIQKLYRAGIIDGSEGKFNPSGHITRAQLAKILVESFDLKMKPGKSLNFTDIPSDHWASEYIQILASNGITTGSNGKFMPNDSLTRGHYAVFLSRLYTN